MPDEDAKLGTPATPQEEETAKTQLQVRLRFD